MVVSDSVCAYVRVLLFDDVQDVPRHPVEEEHSDDCFLVPWHCVFHPVRYQPGAVGGRLATDSDSLS